MTTHDLSETTHDTLVADLSPSAKEAAAASYRAFESLPMPTPSEENWRYVSVPQALASIEVTGDAGGEPTVGAVEALLGELAGRADVVDGHVVAIDGPHLTSIRGSGFHFDSREPADRFAAAAGAFGGDGVVVTAGAGEVIERPIFVSTEVQTDGALSIPRVVVRAAEASSVHVVVEQRSPDGFDALVIPDVDVEAGDAGRVSVTLVQTWGDATTAVGTARMRAGRDAHVELAEAGIGGLFSRIRLDVDLVGRGADATITGAYFGDADQTLDYRYFMNHAGPNTTSEMFLKGAVAGSAQSVFTGLIRIEPDGQGTNAMQTNRNLVLSDDAEAQSVPNLEILANDVRCGHGSAVGPLDEEQRYYLMSRGLPAARADRLQVLGFFEEALQRFPVTSIEPLVRSLAMSKYDQAAG